jgi:DNA repair photolyase
LRRIWNPPNPHLGEHRELLGEAPLSAPKVYEDASRTVLNRVDSPDLGFHWSVNPYRGCFHGCVYCYARTTHEYLGLGAGSDFERMLFVKRDAAALLDRALRRPGWKRELIAFSGVTDCYQPLEASYGITRACLEVCVRHHNPVGIVTKSILVRRDRDLLARLAARADVRVVFSIPFADEDVTRRLEPGAPTVRRRFEAMRSLSDAGIAVGIGIAPIIPGLNDSSIPELLSRARDSGARFAFRTLVRLPGSVADVFLTRLREELPERADKNENRIREVRGGKLSETAYGPRHEGNGVNWKVIDRLWRVWIERLDLCDRPEAPAPNATPNQGVLFQP